MPHTMSVPRKGPHEHVSYHISTKEGVLQTCLIPCRCQGRTLMNTFLTTYATNLRTPWNVVKLWSAE